ncbi:CYTH and CHAD domain-containing protein [Dongia rigui]|uniref:CHAD domain-containing protein n=1 Tax=Dongia rigui TaxID=940149 RepID=A0ABU5E403_9PROT|nr:CHAD domain-containing protein [Dongia rigui]MDY0874315.1 CHAD domain-containing protein [Dongia rigui]
MKNRELELKLSLPDGGDGLRPTALRRLIGAAKAAQSQELETTYFDTPDGWLKRHGMALRIRRIGKRRIQTLKVPGDTVDGLQSYIEFDAEIKAARPQIEAIADQKLRRRFEKERIFDNIRPLFTTRFERSAWLIKRGDSEIEVAFDRGSINARAARVPIGEIELELKAGDPAELFTCAERLVEDLPARLGLSTKAARGYALVAGTQAVPVRGAPMALPHKATAADAFAALARNCLEQLRANEAAIDQSEDDEAIHQFRVAIRRFRAGIGAFRELIDDGAHATMSIDLRWLQRQFGPARDLDVLIADTLVPMQQRLRGHGLIGALLETAEAARAEARHQAHLALENPRYAVMLLQIYRQLLTGGWRTQNAEGASGLDIPVRDFADAWLGRAHKRLVRLGAAHATLSEVDLHRLRLLGKKMRYGAQVFASLYRSKRTEKYLLHLGAIQDHLGSLNDAVVGRHLLVDLIGKLGQQRALSLQETGQLEGIVLGWHSHRIAQDLGGFQETWETFRAQKKFWRGD